MFVSKGENEWESPPTFCGSNAFQDYFNDAKESRAKQVTKNQESRIIKIKIQDSRFKNQEIGLN